MMHDGAGRMGAIGGGRNWLRMLYLTSLSLMLVTAVVYIGNLAFPIMAGSPWQRPLSLLIWLVALALLWFLLDSLGIVDHYPLLADLATGQGLRWLDVTCGVVAIGILLLCLSRQPPEEAVLIVAGLGLLHSILGFLQYQQPYATETLQAAEMAGEHLPSDGRDPEASDGQYTEGA